MENESVDLFNKGTSYQLQYTSDQEIWEEFKSSKLSSSGIQGFNRQKASLSIEDSKLIA
jgi:hypothetical protein